MVVTIELQNMEFRAYHGCYDTEKLVGNTFRVELSVDAEVGDAPLHDRVDESLNYLEVYALVEREMIKVSNIVENVAMRIADSLYEEFPQIRGVRVKVCKLAPPLGGKVGAVCVTINK